MTEFLTRRVPFMVLLLLVVSAFSLAFAVFDYVGENRAAQYCPAPAADVINENVATESAEPEVTSMVEETPTVTPKKVVTATVTPTPEL